MKLPRFSAEPGPLLDFFQEGLDRLGAVCERTWHDRLEVVAEGAAARLWQAEGQLCAVELRFPAPDAPGPRDAGQQIFPGCPLTFRLVETLKQQHVPQLRACLAPPLDADKPPVSGVVQKVWQNQFGRSAQADAGGWTRAWHFSLVAAVRCELQAIDQIWLFHRLAINLADGRQDAALETGLDYFAVQPPVGPVPWPELAAIPWQEWLTRALTEDLRDDLVEVRRRQEHYLRREIDRIDAYFLNYEQELQTRMQRQHKPEAVARCQDRLRIAAAEHARRRDDQVRRHEIRVIPHVDSLLMTAEIAWQTSLRERHGAPLVGTYLPRARRWIV
jgi:hypothetical protein